AGVRSRDARSAEQLREKEFVATVEAENAASQAEVARAQVVAAQASARELEASLGRLELEQRGLEGDARVAALADGAELSAAKVELARYEGDLAETRLEAARLEVEGRSASAYQVGRVSLPGLRRVAGGAVSDGGGHQAEAGGHAGGRALSRERA
ncbi:hypothetical protein, partial [Corallococcus sp. AB038B]